MHACVSYDARRKYLRRVESKHQPKCGHFGAKYLVLHGELQIHLGSDYKTHTDTHIYTFLIDENLSFEK